MAVLRNSRVKDLASRLEQVKPIGIDARVFYRDAAAAGYTEFKTGILFGTDGGGRYSPPSEFPVLYFSADPLACALEVAHHARLLTPVQNVAQLITQIHREIVDIATIQSKLRAADEDAEKTILLGVATKHSFLMQSYNQDPQLLKLYLLAPIPLPHEAIPASPIGGTRINVPLIVTVKVLNLLDHRVLTALGIDRAELVTPTQSWKDAHKSGTWTTCQDLGRAAFLDMRFDGILFPSALPPDEMSTLVRNPINLVVFMDSTTRNKPRATTASYAVSDNFTTVCDMVFGSEIADQLAELEELRKKVRGK